MDSITPEVITLSDFPKWVSRGSTWINQNGFLIDMANLPPDTCKIECDWWFALRSWFDAHATFVSEEDVKQAYLAWQVKQKSCEYCKQRHFSGFRRMKNLAGDRKRRASLPERMKKVNKCTGKLYFIEVDWDQD